ncbi:MAG TPA: carboxypeptidase regulatory-like domain-containing protein, partial [Gemmatimonadota bacterium]|nr:carboxypeptidase regulatory-like domain-containing protein [Gemmatimonadota bacterium]
MRLERAFAGLGTAGLVVLLGLLLPTAEIHAQGVTTAAVTGRVIDAQGAPIENIIVQVTNNSTGVISGGITDENGEYFVAGLQVGGPYTIEASGLGYGAQSNTVPRLTLGQRLTQDFALAQEAIEVAGIVAIAPTVNEIINTSRTGQQQLISEHAIANMPTLGRNFTDFVDLSPLSGAGSGATAIGSQNNRFNNVQIDGVVTQDIFGLGSTGQPGGQAGARSISIEAVKEYQIIAAPFDVRQSGFTGGLINAVTKTGTNEWEATGYYYHRDESLVRDELLDIEFGEFTNTILGGTLAGPIVRDRVHFFVSGEHEKNERPGGDVIAGRDDPAITHVAVSDLEEYIDLLEAKGVTAGGFGPVTVNNPNDNFFGRIDAQLTPNHALTVRHNWVSAEDDVVVNRTGTNNYSLDSNFYFFESETNSTVAQLNSTFGDGFYNELIGGYTRIRDSRTPITGYPELSVVVSDPDGTGTSTLRSGAEQFSQGNSLDQDIWEFQDALSFNVGEHRLTFGVQDQVFDFRNLFTPNIIGSWSFNSLADFEANNPSQFTRAVPFDETFDPNARFAVNNLALYGQTDYRGIENVVLTAGLRFDMPSVLDDPIENPDVEEAFGIRTNEVNLNNILSPRFGFNWDVYGDQSTQVRGGVGLFTGRQPFVWLSNLYGMTGRSTVSITCRAADGHLPTFTLDPTNQPESCAGTGIPAPPRAVINLIDEDFEFPNAWRFDAALDRELPWWGIVGTAEFIYTKYANQIFLEEINVDKEPVSFTQGGRP